MSQKEDRRAPPLQYDDYKWDNRDKIDQNPDGSFVVRRFISKQETHAEISSTGSYFEHRGGESGSTVEFTANNRVSYAKGGKSSNVDQDNDEKDHGHKRYNSHHDGHTTFGKTASTVHGQHFAMHSQGDIKISARANIGVSSGKGDIAIASSRDIVVSSDEGRTFIASKKGVVQISSEAASPAGDVHYHSERKGFFNTKDDMGMNGEKSWNASYKEKITHEAKDAVNHKTDKDHFIVVKEFSWLGQETKDEKVGDFVLTLSGPAKKAKAKVK